MQTTRFPLAPDQLTRLLSALRRYQGSPYQRAIGIRNESLTILLLETGLRLYEALRLTRLDLTSPMTYMGDLVLPGACAKYHVSRIVPLSLPARHAIVTLQRLYWPLISPTHERWAFPGATPTSTLSPRTYQRYLHSASKKSLCWHLSAQDLRTMFAVANLQTHSHAEMAALLGLVHPHSLHPYLDRYAEYQRVVSVA